MATKRIITTLLLAYCIITSCVKDSTKNEPGINTSNIATYERINTTTTLDVPAKQGSITVVTFQGNIICLTKTPTSIIVPKTNTEAKSGEAIEIKYVDQADPEYAEALGDNDTKSELWQTIAFEDSMVGDYDYNDLVLHLCYQLLTPNKETQKLYIGIHPIAYGATKNIKLGLCVYYKNQEVCREDITQNSKEELFLDNNGKYCGISDMINTSSQNYSSNFYTKVLKLDAANVNFSDIKVIWYITVDKTTKFYMVNSKYNFLDKNKRPYGIAITNTAKIWPDSDNGKAENSASWFEYPVEGNNISNCYTDQENDGIHSFDNWISGNSPSMNMRNPKNVFNITEKKNGHFIYQIENANDKDLSRDKYKEITIELTRNK